MHGAGPLHTARELLLYCRDTYERDDGVLWGVLTSIACADMDSSEPARTLVPVFLAPWSSYKRPFRRVFVVVWTKTRRANVARDGAPCSRQQWTRTAQRTIQTRTPQRNATFARNTVCSKKRLAVRHIPLFNATTTPTHTMQNMCDRRTTTRPISRVRSQKPTRSFPKVCTVMMPSSPLNPLVQSRTRPKRPSTRPSFEMSRVSVHKRRAL